MTRVSGLRLHGHEFTVIKRFGAAHCDTIAGLQFTTHGDLVATGLADFHGDALSLGVIIDAHHECTVFSQYHGIARHGQCEIG